MEKKVKWKNVRGVCANGYGFSVLKRSFKAIYYRFAGCDITGGQGNVRYRCSMVAFVTCEVVNLWAFKLFLKFTAKLIGGGVINSGKVNFDDSLGMWHLPKVLKIYFWFKKLDWNFPDVEFVGIQHIKGEFCWWSWKCLGKEDSPCQACVFR